MLLKAQNFTDFLLLLTVVQKINRKLLKNIKQLLTHWNLSMMKTSVLLFKILFPDRIATAHSNIFLRIKEAQKQQQEAYKIFTSASHMFLLLTKNLRALLFVICAIKEILFNQMIYRVSGFLKLLKEAKFIKASIKLWFKMAKVKK